ncbi:MAG TPA: class I SAM-dependent methyltransferase [Flavobacterium sp.]|jgi:trans-aconitate methyltransferase
MTDNCKNTIEAYGKLAKLYQDKFMDLDLYNDTYDAFCEAIPHEAATVFEIGCGPGNITRYLVSRRPDFKIFSTDAAPEMVDLARVNVPQATFEVMDCREISSITQKFNAIICGFCMPYLSKEDCSTLISDCASLLESDGIFYFSVIEGDYARS